MATTRTIRPNGGSQTGSWVFNAGAAGLADDIDSTDLFSSVGDGTATLQFDTYTLASTERCLRARARTRGRVRGSGTTYSQRLRVSGNDAAANSFTNSDTMNDKVGSWIIDPPGAATEWTQTEIDALEMYLVYQDNYPTAFNPLGLVAEAYIDLDVITQASASISSPSAGGIVNSLTPTVGWTYVGNGEAQKKYRLKVFTEAVVNGGGFDPDSSTPVYDSGVITSSATSKQVTTPLNYGDEYFAYVKVTKDFNGTDWDGSWSTGSQFFVMSKPTLTIDGPAGTVADTNKPLLEWSYSDADGQPQTAFEMKVFQEPGGGWAGLDPDTDTPEWTSGIVTSAAASIQVGVGLPNLTNFRTYGRVRKSTPGEVWSDWAFEEFDTNFTAPLAPVITVTDLGDRIQVDVTPQTSGGDPDPDWHNIYRSIDGGITWQFFRYGSLLTTEDYPATTSPFTLYDYEPPLGVELHYKAVAITTDSGEEVASVDSNIATVTASAVVAWLKDPSDSSLNAQFPIQDQWLQVTKKKSRSIQRALGRTKPVVLRGESGEFSFSITFTIITEAQFEALYDLIDAERTLFVQTPKGSWYAEIAADVSNQMHLWDDLMGEQDVYKVTIPFIEVDF